MIITPYGIIVFQITELIAIETLYGQASYRPVADMLGFSFLAIPSRHDISEWPYL